MAERASYALRSASDEIVDTSEEIIENPCVLCFTNENKQIESTQFCVDCGHNICEPCARLHRKFPIMAKHQLIGLLQLPTQRCQEHHGKLLDKYCTAHDEVACDTCVAIYHMQCEPMKYVPSLAKGTNKDKEFKEITHSAKSLLEAFKDMKSSREDTLQLLATEKQQCQQAITDQRDRMVKRLEELAQKDSLKLKSKFEEQETAVKKELTTVDDQIEATETLLKSLTGSKGNNEAELFVDITQGRKAEKNGKQLLQAMQQSPTKIPKYTFLKASEKALNNSSSLVKFDDEQLNVVLKLDGVCNAKVPGNKSKCHITGVCYLPDGCILAADYENKSVKHIDTSYKVKTIANMSSAPCDICLVNNNKEVAVTLPLEKKIKFKSVGGSKGKSSIHTGVICRAIACNDLELFVGCGSISDPTESCVQVYDMAGTLLRTIQFDTIGRRLFTIISRIVASSCNTRINITDKEHGIITTDRTGNLLATFSDPKLSDARGMCLLANDDLLVCTRGSNTILHVPGDRGKMRDVLEGQDRIVEPVTMAYDPVHSRMVVTTAENDIIKIYEVLVE